MSTNYIITQVSSVLFFFSSHLLPFDTSPHLFLQQPQSPLVVLPTRPYQRVRAVVQLRSTVSRYFRPVYVRTLYFVQRYLI